jgi:hypothetical protein
MVSMGLLAPGAEPLTASKGKGINETWRGRVHLIDGSTVQAYVKLLDPRQLSNELLGAELARTVGFQVPEAYLVRIDKSDYVDLFAKLNITENQIIAYGCRDVGRNSLARRYSDGGLPFLLWFIKECHHWKRIVSFDAWIGNIDRNLGNALIGSPNDIWLIDHGYCFTGPTWTEAQLLPSGIFANRMINDFNPHLTNDLRDAVVVEAKDAQKVFDVVHVEGVLQDSYAGSYLTNSERTAVSYFVEKRKPQVLAMVSTALGRPMLPFDGDNA